MPGTTARVWSLALVLTATTAATLRGQDIGRWDVARFDQGGQRSLFLRSSSGGVRGLPLGAGDVNGDGRDDVLLCAFSAAEAFLFFSPPVNAGQQEGVPQAGVVTRVFGVPSLGVECATGDVNDDGLADLILGAPAVTAPGRIGAGAVYVVFGSPALPATIDVRSAPGVLAIVGADAGDHFGVWVDDVDVDGDGVDDVLIGAPDADGPANDRQNAGEAYVIYGGADIGAGTRELTGFVAQGRVSTVYGADPSDKTGSAVHAGRIDGDEVADLVVGSALNRAAVAVFGSGVEGADGPDELRSEAGEVAIVFGPSRGASVDLADPPADAAFVYGADAGDFAGEEVNVGDADGDGFGDVLIGALTAAGRDNLSPNTGEAYLVYGGSGLRGARIDLRQLPDGVTVIYGPTAGAITGDSARFIDIDGDGRGDVFIGSPTGTFTGADGRARTGALFFLRAPAGHLPAVIDLDDPPLDTLPMGVILAADPGDILSYSLVRGRVDGDTAEDVIVNGMAADGLGNAFVDAGEAYVLSGAALAAAVAPFASGDLNGDGRSDLVDLQRAIAGLVGRAALSEAERRAADTNGNGDLDVGDLIGLLDRVLERNLLVPGALGRGRLTKEADEPEYRYDEPGEGGGTGAYGLSGAAVGGRPPVAGVFEQAVPRVPSPSALAPARTTFSLAGPKAALDDGIRRGAAEAPLPVHSVEVVFRLPRGLAVAPGVIGRPGLTVSSHRTGGELRVVVLSTEDLPRDTPLFEIVGPAPSVVKVEAATSGGSLRALSRFGSPRESLTPTGVAPARAGAQGR